MKCPKCGSEMIQKWPRSGGRRLVYCPKCGLDAAWVFGHEEKVGVPVGSENGPMNLVNRAKKVGGKKESILSDEPQDWRTTKEVEKP